MKKTILVFGASSGYGNGIASYLCSLGYNVIAVSRTIESSTNLFYKSINCDVTIQHDVEALFEALQYEAIDGVVYSCGIAIGKNTIENGGVDDWKQVFNTNTLGLLNVAKHAVPKLKETEGYFIHIGSIAYEFSYPGGADYCASKAAAHSIVMTLRAELLGTNVTVTTIEPGLGETNFQKNRYDGDMEQAKKHYSGIEQLQPLDLGHMVAYILFIPKRVNIDTIVIKPIQQLTHGVTAKNKQEF